MSWVCGRPPGNWAVTVAWSQPTGRARISGAPLRRIGRKARHRPSDRTGRSRWFSSDKGNGQIQEHSGTGCFEPRSGSLACLTVSHPNFGAGQCTLSAPRCCTQCSTKLFGCEPAGKSSVAENIREKNWPTPFRTSNQFIQVENIWVAPKSWEQLGNKMGPTRVAGVVLT